MAELPSGTVTFLFTDIEGSTRLVKQLGDGYGAVLAEHQRLLREAFAGHGGHEIDTQGDSFFVAFRRARDAVAAAVAAQQALAAHEWPAGVTVRVRMGLHSGEPAVGDDRYTGLGVHRAARVSAAGHGGQILLSETTRSLVEDDLPPGVQLRDLGRVTLKDLDRSERVSQLVVEGLPADFPRLRSHVRAPTYRRRTVLIGALAGVIAAAVAIPVFTLGQGSSGGMVAQENSVAMIDPGRNRVEGDIPVGAAPGAIASGAGSLWVVNDDDRTVSQIDPGKEQRLGSISFPDAPSGIAATDSAVWTVAPNAQNLSVTVGKIDPQFGTRTTLTHLGNAEQSGGGSVAAGRDGLWVAPSSGLVTKLDPRTGRVLGKPIDPQSGVTAIAVGDGAVWIADADGNSVTRVDSTGLVTPIPVGNSPGALAVDGSGVWVAETLDNAVKRIDPTTHAPTTRILVGRAPSGVAVGAGSVWVANSRDGTVTRIDEKTRKAVKTIEVGGSPQGLTFADGHVWVTVDEPVFASAEAAGAGGTLHVTYPDSPGGPLDPGLSFTVESSAILNPTCVKLLNYPDKAAPAGGHLEPEAARSLPTVSHGGRTYTFRIRRGFRFSPPSHERVTAETFKFTIERSLSPKLKGPARSFLGDVVGANAYIGGKAAHISGVVARGDTLKIRLVRPAPDLLSRIALDFFCAVPLDTPIVPGGVRAIPAPGPYYVSADNGQGVLLLRNPNYSGSRPHNFAQMEFEFNVKSTTADSEVEAGKIDYAGVDPSDRAHLERQFGPGSAAARQGRQQLFTSPSVGLEYLLLNTTRGLFRDPRLRRAASLAVDRGALAAGGEWLFGGSERVADGYLPPGVPGYTDKRLFPPHGDLAAARRLAGHKRRTAVMYSCESSRCARIAQIVKTDLARIGISVDVRVIPIRAYFKREFTPGEPFDIAIGLWAADYLDPSDFLNYAIATPTAAGPGYHDPPFERRLAATALLSGPRRYLAYSKLATALARDSAPWIVFGNPASEDFFSARIGCQIEQPLNGVDFAALCLRKS